METNELNVGNVDHLESTSKQPLVIPSQNGNTEITKMCAKRYKGLVYSKECLAQKKDRHYPSASPRN